MEGSYFPRLHSRVVKQGDIIGVVGFPGWCFLLYEGKLQNCNLTKVIAKEPQ